MFRNLILMTAAVALLIGAGCGNDRTPISPTLDGTTEMPLTQDANETGLVTVVHGIPGLTVDVYVNGALTLPSFEPGTVTDPLELPQDNYDILIVPAGGVYPDDAVIIGSAFLPAGANASIVAHLTEAGQAVLTVFVNDISEIPGIGSRVVVRHVAQAPTVDVRLFRRILPRWPVRTIQDLSNPNEAQTEVFPGSFRAKLYPANSSTPVFTSPYLALLPRESTIVYAIGSLADGTFDVLVQKIDLRDRSKGLNRVTSEYRSDLTPEEYDAIAAEKKIDLLQ